MDISLEPRCDMGIKMRWGFRLHFPRSRSFNSVKDSDIWIPGYLHPMVYQAPDVWYVYGFLLGASAAPSSFWYKSPEQNSLI